MTIATGLLQELEQEAVTTRRVLDRVPDGRMAWKIVRKRVQLTAPDSTGRPVAEDVVYAWVEIYEKPQDRWILKAVASTDRPGP